MKYKVTLLSRWPGSLNLPYDTLIKLSAFDV